MKFLKTLFVLSCASLALFLSGCASDNYKTYAEGQSKVEIAKHEADKARYEAMAKIAASGDSTAKIAAVMAMAMGQSNSGTESKMQAPAPNEALQWASILVPGLTQVAGIYYNHQSSIVQSNNAASVAMSTNNAFVGISSKIQGSSVVNNTDNNSVTNTLSGVGVLGTGTYGTTDNHSSQLVSPPTVITPTVITPVQIVPVR